MLHRIARLFQIRTRFEAFAVIYALSIGAVERGHVYLQQYPGVGGYLLFGACTAAVFMGGGKILDAVRLNRERSATVSGQAKTPHFQVTAS